MTSNEETIALEPEHEAAHRAGTVASAAGGAAASAEIPSLPPAQASSRQCIEEGPQAGDPAATVKPPRVLFVAALHRCIAIARRVPADAGLAAGIALVALTLALLAGDGQGEFPGPAFERALLSHAPAPAVRASGWLAVDTTVPESRLARKLVEDPAFDPLPNEERGGQPPPAARGDSQGGLHLTRARPQAGPDDSGGAAAPNPAVQSDDGPKAGVASRRAEEVLAAATPVPPIGRARGDDAGLQRSAVTGENVPGAAASRPADAAPAAQSIEIQLVAVWRRDQAVDVWNRLQSGNGDLLSDLRPVLVEPDGRRTTLYRLRAGPFASAEQAQARCAALNERRVDCIVVREGG